MSILEAIAANASAHPHRTAYVQNTLAGKKSLTWHELDTYSNSLATHIVRTAQSHKPVVVYGHKDPLVVVGFVACSKAGRAYCPVDVSVPEGRLQDIVFEVQPELILALEELPPINAAGATILSAGEIKDIATAGDAIDLSPYGVGPNDVYYIIFTSGSTGKPKGVQITRDCLDNFICWGTTLCENAAEEGYVFINQAPFSFDLSVMDLYLSLALGGTEFALDKQLLNSMGTLFERLRTSGATVWVSTPSFVEMCLADPSFNQELLPHMRTFLFCGETLTNRTAERLLKGFPLAEVYNTYGPTESTVAVTGIQVTKEVLGNYAPLPIGRPKRGTFIRIQDAKGNEVPNGQRGEIVIVGNSVSVGYFHDEKRTREAFAVEQMDGQPVRSYRTGDEGYVQGDLLFYSGRIDLQIKMHGYRIELEDIEANIAALPGVERAAVLPVRKPDGAIRSLTAFLVMDVPASGFSRQDAKELRARLASSLPAYMIPKRIRVVDSLPMTSNGKVDRRGLANL